MQMILQGAHRWDCLSGWNDAVSEGTQLDLEAAMAEAVVHLLPHKHPRYVAPQFECDREAFDVLKAQITTPLPAPTLEEMCRFADRMRARLAEDIPDHVRRPLTEAIGRLDAALATGDLSAFAPKPRENWLDETSPAYRGIPITVN